MTVQLPCIYICRYLNKDSDEVFKNIMKTNWQKSQREAAGILSLRCCRINEVNVMDIKYWSYSLPVWPLPYAAITSRSELAGTFWFTRHQFLSFAFFANNFTFTNVFDEENIFKSCRKTSIDRMTVEILCSSWLPQPSIHSDFPLHPEKNPKWINCTIYITYIADFTVGLLATVLE